MATAGLFLTPASAQPTTSSPVEVDSGPAILYDWVQPEYPVAARAAKLEGTVTVDLVVELDGSVTRESVSNSTNEIFNAAALAAVKRWKFKPALENGAPGVSAMRVPVVFELAQLRRKSPRLFPREQHLPRPIEVTPAKPDRGIEPPYPGELEARQLSGAVHLEFTVDAAGKVEGTRVLWATHPALVETSLRAIERAEFTPARQGPLAKSSTVQYPVIFDSIGAKPSTVLAANGLTLVSTEPLLFLPLIRMFIVPVYPRDKMLTGVAGKGEAEFTIDENGAPRGITLSPATPPEFGPALVAAIEAWVFKPAQNEQGPVAVRMRATHEFSLQPEQAEYRLRSLLMPGGAGVGGAAGLDRKLTPLWRGLPVYPQSLLHQPQKGEASIEFIIDRDGRVRLPKIISATAEAFGWSAVTAISQWVFARPTRGSEPVDVLVRVPVSFIPPAN